MCSKENREREGKIKKERDDSSKIYQSLRLRARSDDYLTNEGAYDRRISRTRHTERQARENVAFGFAKRVELLWREYELNTYLSIS